MHCITRSYTEFNRCCCRYLKRVSHITYLSIHAYFPAFSFSFAAFLARYLSLALMTSASVF